MGTYLTDGRNRKAAVVDAAKVLSNSLITKIPTLKIGIIKFSDNANIISSLTNNKDSVSGNLTNFRDTSTEGGTNIEKGMNLAKKSFTNTCDRKIIVLLTDGVPSSDEIGSGNAQTIYNNTKNSLKSNDIYTISLLTGLEGITADISNVINMIFGTKENPTADEFYNIKDSDIQINIQENIYNDIIEKMEKKIKEITLVDYFPKEIIDNFTFEYVTKPNIGTISDKINEETRSIEWKINEIKIGQSATVKYKLILKNKENKDLIEKILSTNEKIDLNYKDNSKKEYNTKLEDSPKIKLIAEENGKDNTISNSVLPKAGLAELIIPILITLISIVLIISIYKLKTKK